MCATFSQVEDISNLLNTGEVPNLFDTGETLALCEAVRTRAKQAKMDGSRADLYNFFVSEVHDPAHTLNILTLKLHSVSGSNNPLSLLSHPLRANIDDN